MMQRMATRAADLSRLFQWESSFDEGRTRPSVFLLPTVSAVVAPFVDHRVKLTNQEFRGLLMEVLASVPASQEASIPTALVTEPWQFLYGSVSSLAFIAEEPLRSRLDTTTDPLHEVYRVLWEIRFAINEGDFAKGKWYASTLIKWASGARLTTEQSQRLTSLGARPHLNGDDFYDVLCCLLALAKQNDALTHLRLGFEVDEIAAPTLNELKKWIQMIDRWVRTGPFPVGVILIGEKASSVLSPASPKRR